MVLKSFLASDGICGQFYIERFNKHFEESEVALQNLTAAFPLIIGFGQIVIRKLNSLYVNRVFY